MKSLVRPRVLVPLAVLLGAVYLGRLTALAGNFGLREVAIGAIGSGAILFVIYVLTTDRERLLVTFFSALPLTLLVGLRGLTQTGTFVLYLPQVYLFALATLVMIRNTVRHQPMRVLHSRAELGFLYIGFMGLVLAVVNGRPTDAWLNDVLSWFVFLPALWCVHELNVSRADLQRMMILLTGVVLVIGLSGVFDFVRGVGQSVSVTLQSGAGYLAPDATFFRVSFLTWGGYAAADVLLLALPIALMSFDLSVKRRWRIVAAVAALLCLFGIAASGYRGLWLAAGGTLVLALLFQWRKAIWGLLVAASIVLLAPALFAGRLAQIFAGAAADGSTRDRIGRVQLAWNVAAANPLTGAGWGASGWVHNDVVQLAADASIPAAILFVLLVGSLIWRLWRKQRLLSEVAPELARAWQPISQGLALSLCGGLFAMLSQTFIIVSLLMALFWWIYALADRTLTLMDQELANARHDP